METGNEGCVLVTGSSGLIGRGVVDRFARRHRVVGLDVVEPNRLPDGASFVPCDVSSSSSVAEALDRVRDEQGDRVASVLHLAAYVDFSGAPSEKYEEITVRGTERLMRGLRERFRVEQFAFSSTLLVHRPCEPGERIDEDWPVEPKWPYPESKVRTERLLRETHGDVPIALLRLAGVYDDRCHSLPLAHQIQRIYERRITGRVFPGDTARGQSLIHYEDMLEALERLVERRADLPPELMLVLGEPDPVSYEELQRRFGELIHGRQWVTRHMPRPLAKTGAWLQEKVPLGEEPFIRSWMVDMADDHYALDISRARGLLDWEPRHELRETLPNMIEALNADPLGWYREHKLTPPRWLRQAIEERPRA